MAESLDLFGDRWSILIIRDAMNGVRRFDELVGRLEISRATLSDRLRRLTAAGILEPADYQAGRGRTRTEYRLTPSGWDLRNVLIALREWGDRHVLGEGNEPLALIDHTTGHNVRLQLVDDETGEAVEPRHLRHVAGPAVAVLASSTDRANQQPVRVEATS
ncbi:MAG: helix-turn-helix domain-containing protein [Ilumatobacteraceae bacterium]